MNKKRGRSGRSENITEREKRHARREKKCSESIIAESKRSSVDKSGLISLVQNNAEQGKDSIGKGVQTTAAKYMGQWKIMG